MYPIHKIIITKSKKYVMYHRKDMKSFIAKRVNSKIWDIIKLLKYKENNKKICNTFV